MSLTSKLPLFEMTSSDSSILSMVGDPGTGSTKVKMTSQSQRILARLKAGGRIPMPELSRIGSGKDDGWCASFSRRVSDIRRSGFTVNCYVRHEAGRKLTEYELIGGGE